MKIKFKNALWIPLYKHELVKWFKDNRNWNVSHKTKKELYAMYFKERLKENQ